MRVTPADPTAPIADSYQAVLPVVDAPEGGIVFPGSEFLAALDDLEHRRGVRLRHPPAPPGRAKWSSPQRPCPRQHGRPVRPARRRPQRHTELHATDRKIAEYNRLLSANIDEQPLCRPHSSSPSERRPTHARPQHQTAARGAEPVRPDRDAPLPRRPHPAVVGVQSRRTAYTRAASTSSVTPPRHRNGHGSCRSPPAQLGNSTGILLGFNKSNALNSAVLLDLPGTARRNHNPCLVCAGAPGYGKSYAAKRLVTPSLPRGAQAFIVDPDDYGEWATALADVPNNAVIDMAGADFGCDPCGSSPSASPAVLA